MLGQCGKGQIKLKCTEPLIAEFPDLMFGSINDESVFYFDATLYLQVKFPDLSVNDFFTKYMFQITALCEAYGIEKEDIKKINEQGHILIDGSLTYLFISFCEPHFLAYMCDRIHELMSYGIAVSDTYLLQSVNRRLTGDILEQLIKHVRKNESSQDSSIQSI